MNVDEWREAALHRTMDHGRSGMKPLRLKGCVLKTDDSLGWIADEARRLRGLGAMRGKAWSLAQVCEHMALAINSTVDSPARETASQGVRDKVASVDPPVWWTDLARLERLKRRAVRCGLLWSGRFPEGVPSPAFVRPTDAVELDVAITMLKLATEAFDRKLKQADARWVYHPLLGPMRGSRWKRFHDLHARHHFKFMTVG